MLLPEEVIRAGTWRKERCAIADNVELNPGTGGSVVATDDDGTAHHQYVKLEYGADGVFTKVDSTNRLPVSTEMAKQEDSAHTTGDVGVMLLGVRNDSNVALSDTNFDYTPVATDSAGSVVVRLNGGNPGTTGGSLGKLEDAGHGTGHTGVFVLAVRQDAPANSAGTDADYCAFGVSADGGAWTTPTPSSSGGLSIFRSIDLDESEEEVKATAGTVYGMWVTNTATATRWVKFYNATAANVTVGTTTPVITIAIPGNASDDVSGNFGPGGMGIGFSTAISVAATTGVADNDTGAPGANEVICNIFFK